MKPNSLWGSALISAICSTSVRGGIVSGSYRGSETWRYLDRFVFIPSTNEETGRLEVNLDFSETEWQNPALMLYFKGGEEGGVQKEFGLWDRAYNNELTCEEKALIAQQKGGMFVPLPGGYGGKSYVDENGEPRWSVSFAADMVTSRARWMFIAVGNCMPQCGRAHCSGSLDFRYTLNLTNGVSKSRYFSADERGKLEIASAFSILYTVLFFFAFYTRYLLRQEQKYHYSVQLLFWSIIFSCASVYSDAFNYSYYASTGRRNSNTDTASVTLNLISECLLLLMIILVAKGWTIVRRKISATGRTRIAAYLTVYVVANIACWVYYIHFTDPASIVYIYSTLPGIIIVFLRIFAFGWLSYAIYTTLRAYQQKKAFYKKYWGFSGVWILSLPLQVALTYVVDMWIRAKTMYLLPLLFNFSCQLVLIMMYNPKGLCGLNRNFPFHATSNCHMKKVDNQTGGKHDNPNRATHGGNSFDEAHLLRAFQISTQMRHSVLMLQTYTSDLHTFLDGIRQRSSTSETMVQSGVGVDLEAPKQTPLLGQAGNTALRSKEENPLEKKTSTSFLKKKPSDRKSSNNSSTNLADLIPSRQSLSQNKSGEISKN